MSHLAREPQHEMVERTWTGSADLLDANGDITHSVAAELWQHAQAGRGTQWGGRLQAPASAEAPHLPTAEYTYTIRLAGGGEGRVTSQGAPRVHLFTEPEAHEEVDVMGFGPPPF